MIEPVSDNAAADKVPLTVTVAELEMPATVRVPELAVIEPPVAVIETVTVSVYW